MISFRRDDEAEGDEEAWVFSSFFAKKEGLFIWVITKDDYWSS